MIQLNCSFMMKLRIQEFPQAIKEITAIYDEDQIEELHLKESLSRLKAHNSDLDFVWDMRNPHPLTAVLQEQIKTCKGYLVGLRARIRAIMKSPNEEERAAAHTAFLWINKHHDHIYSLSRIIQTRLIDNLQAELSKSEKIVEALTTLNLFAVVDSIVSLRRSIASNVRIRQNDIQENLSKAEVIKRATYSDLVNFLHSLKTAINLEDPTVGFYADYEQKIEACMDEYKFRLSIRNTRRANANLDKPEVNDSDVDSGEELPEDASNGEETQSMSYNPFNDNGSDNGSMNYSLLKNRELTDAPNGEMRNDLDQSNEKHV